MIRPVLAALAALFLLSACGNGVQAPNPVRPVLTAVIANRMIKAHRKGAKIIVADPRRVPMVRFSEIFLNLRPGTDVALLNGLAHVILKEGLHDKEFIKERTERFEEWEKSVEVFTPEYVEEITGVPRDLIVRAARMYGGSRKAGIFYTMGITQHTTGTDNVYAIANLALLTGNIGKPSTGVNPLRGQNNVQGASDAACLPNVFPGYQRVDVLEIREKFEIGQAKCARASRSACTFK